MICIEVTVFCDGDGCSAHQRMTLDDMVDVRQQVANWLRYGAEITWSAGGKQLCPTCREKRRAARKEAPHGD